MTSNLSETAKHFIEMTRRTIRNMGARGTLPKRPFMEISTDDDDIVNPPQITRIEPIQPMLNVQEQYVEGPSSPSYESDSEVYLK
jgi:hypothetical protein